jgi:hypothetical protein
MHVVGSRGIAAIGYDHQGKSLLIRYRRSQTIYAYTGVPLQTYAELMQAESKGQFVNFYIKPRYSFRPISGQDIVAPEPPNTTLEKLKQLRRGTVLGGLSWRALRDAGRP